MMFSMLFLTWFMQPTQPPTMMPWEDFLLWLTNPTVLPAVIGVAASVLIDYIPGFENAGKKLKTAAFFALSILIPFAAAWLGVWTEGWDLSWQITFWPAIQAGVLAFASGTLTHRYIPVKELLGKK